MPCPTCGSKDVIPLTLRSFDHLCGAAKLCEACNTVFLVADEAALPKPLRKKQKADWEGIQKAVYDALDEIRFHPVINDFLDRDGVDSQTWYRDSGEILERLVTGLIPAIRALDLSCYVCSVARKGCVVSASVHPSKDEAIKEADLCGGEHFNPGEDDIVVFEIGPDGSGEEIYGFCEKEGD
ncbi:MAG: hypothetical protein V1809_00225 [Planctomycetota bacterium]